MLYTNKDLVKLIIPLIIEQVLIMLVGMVDVMMISRVGEAAVSGVSLVDTVNVLIINIFTALATGGAVVAGHFLGQKNKERACDAAWQLVLFSFLSSMVVMLIFLGVHDLILKYVFGKIEPDVYRNAKIYLIITALSIVPLSVYNATAAIFRSVNKAMITMLISLMMNALNIGGNYLLIYVIPMGVKGAAISTTLSRTAAAIVGMLLLFQKKREIHFNGHITWRMKPDIIKKILYVGLPNGLENSLFQLGKILVLSLVSTLGTYAIAANAVAGTVAMFNVLPGMAINYAILSIASYCVGAGEMEQVKYYTKKLIFIIYGAMWVLSIGIIFGVDHILNLYHLTAESAALTAQVVRFHAIMAMFFWAPSFSITNMLRAAGDVIYPTIISAVSMWVFRIGSAYLLCGYFHMGLMGVWIAMVIDWIFRAACFLFRYKQGRWQYVYRKKDKELV